MNKERFYNQNVGPIKENEVKAFKKALELSKSISDIDEIILLIHTKSNTGYIERIFDTRDIKQLFKGAKIHKDYPKVKIETVRAINDLPNINRIILAFGLRSDELSVYEDYYGCKAIVAHQWSLESVTKWAKNWGAINLDDNSKSEKNKLPDIVVQNAFTELTNVINRSTGITHPMDEERCKTYIRALNKYNYELNPDEISAYLTRELNWDYDDCKDVIKLIEKINSGGYFQGGQKTGLKNHINRWKK